MKISLKCKLKSWLIKFRYGYYFSHINNKITKEEKTLAFNVKYHNYLKRRYKKEIKEILNNLKPATGITSKKIWWCWLQGEENAFDLNKACLKSLRENLSDRDIIVITEENLYNYIDFPDYIKEKYKKGFISRTHFSDLIRLQLLIKYGGTWIDSSVYCTGFNKVSKSYFDKELFVFSNWRRNDPTICLSSWFITSAKDNPILIATRDLLFIYWKDHDYLGHYFLFHLFFTIIAEELKDEWNKVSRFSNLPPHILQFEMMNDYNDERFDEIKSMSDFHKLNQKMKIDNKNSYFNYFCNQVKSKK